MQLKSLCMFAKLKKLLNNKGNTLAQSFTCFKVCCELEKTK